MDYYFNSKTKKKKKIFHIPIPFSILLSSYLH